MVWGCRAVGGVSRSAEAIRIDGAFAEWSLRKEKRLISAAFFIECVNKHVD